MSDDERKKKALEFYQKGERLQLDGKLNQAIAWYTRSIEIYPTAEAHTHRGWAYSAKGRLDDAIEECKTAISLDPSYGNPYNDIGSYLLQQGEHDEALGWLKKAKIAPRYEPRHFPYINLGRAYSAKGMIMKAIKEFEGALKFAPDDPGVVSALDDLRRKLN